MNDRAEIVKKAENNPEAAKQVKSVAPAVDIFENENEILLHVDMPGVERKDVNVNIDNGKLSLSGLRKLARKGVAKGEEFGDIEYLRMFSVPQTIDVEKVNAELKDGVLRLHLPKSEADKPKRIEIKAA